LEKEFAEVEAFHDFNPSVMGLNRAKSRALMVMKGDCFKVFKIESREWWGVRCLQSDQIGYVPSSYMRPKDIADSDAIAERLALWQAAMDAAALAELTREVKITQKAKQTGQDAPNQEMSRILEKRKEGGSIKTVKPPPLEDSGMSSELQAMLKKRTRIIEEDELAKESAAAEPEFMKVSLKKTGAESEDKENAEDQS